MEYYYLDRLGVGDLGCSFVYVVYKYVFPYCWNLYFRCGEGVLGVRRQMKSLEFFWSLRWLLSEWGEWVRGDLGDQEVNGCLLLVVVCVVVLL